MTTAPHEALQDILRLYVLGLLGQGPGFRTARVPAKRRQTLRELALRCGGKPLRGCPDTVNFTIDNFCYQIRGEGITRTGEL